MFKKVKKKRFIETFYKLDMTVVSSKISIRVCQWNPFDEKLYVKAKYNIDFESLEKFGQYVKKDLINKGFVWLKDEDMDKVCVSFNWPLQNHFLKCVKCNNFRFIPLMNFYTGCTVCNSLDNGSYTYFEAQEKSERL